MWFAQFAGQVIKWGRLTIIDAHGRRHAIDNHNGPSATIRLHDRALHHRLAWNPYLYVGEAYLDRTLTIERGTAAAAGAAGPSIQSGQSGRPRARQRRAPP